MDYKIGDKYFRGLLISHGSSAEVFVGQSWPKPRFSSNHLCLISRIVIHHNVVTSLVYSDVGTNIQTNEQVAMKLVRIIILEMKSSIEDTVCCMICNREREV